MNPRLANFNTIRNKQKPALALLTVYRPLILLINTCCFNNLYNTLAINNSTNLLGRVQIALLFNLFLKVWLGWGGGRGREEFGGRGDGEGREL